MALFRPNVDTLKRRGDLRGLVGVLGRPKPQERRAAIDALGELGDASAVEPVIARLGDDEVDVRAAAIRTLGALADPRAVVPLIAIAEDESAVPVLRDMAIEALGDVGGSQALEVVRRAASSDAAFAPVLRRAEKRANGADVLETQVGPPERTELMEQLPEPARAVAHALKQWYAAEAKRWWKEAGRTEAVCDDGSENIEPGEGYLRPGGNLCCERCTDAFFTYVSDWERALGRVESHFGPGVPEPIQELARTALEASRIAER